MTVKAMVRVFMIGERSNDYRTLQKQATTDEPRIQFVGFSHAEIPDCSLTSPDVILLDTVCEDAIVDLLSKLQTMGSQAKILLISPHDNEQWMQRLIELGVDYCLLKPLDTTTLLRRLVQLATPEWQSPQTMAREQQRWHWENEITEQLIELGVPNHYNGFAYLKTAIAYVMENENALNQMTHVLYPFVASRYNVSPSHVERSIRHAIEVTWVRGNMSRIHALFAYTIDQDKGKPTNSLFIARLADHMRLASPPAVS